MLLGSRGPRRAGLSPGLAPNCCGWGVGGAARGWRAAWARGQSAHRWAAPPALLGPEGARAGVKALGFLGHLRAGGPAS